jgi:hypothetical protein
MIKPFIHKELPEAKGKLGGAALPFQLLFTFLSIATTGAQIFRAGSYNCYDNNVFFQYVRQDVTSQVFYLIDLSIQ